jgi:hypothetical protein
MRVAVIDSVVFNPLVFSIANRPASDCTNSATDQSAGRFVISLVTDRCTNRCPRKSTQQGAAAPIGMALCHRGLRRYSNQDDQKRKT